MTTALKKHFPDFLFFLATLAYCLSSITRPLDMYDEGVMLAGADRVLHGEIPYRDFWTIYAPGQFYLLAGWFSVFGTGVIQARILDCLVKSAIVFLIWRLSLRALSSQIRIVPVLLSLLWIERLGRFSSTIFPALLLAYLATLLVIQCANETNRTEYRTKLLLIGVILGCLVLFRYDVAVYVGLALGAILIGNNLGLRLVSNVELFARLFSGSALILVLPVLGLLTFVPFAELREQLYEFPLKIYPVYRSLALPGVLSSLGFSSVGDLFSNLQAMTFSNFAQFYFPYISIVLSAGLLIYRMFRRDSNSYSRAQISILSLTLALSLYASVRADFSHLAPLYFTCFIICTGMLEYGLRANFAVKSLALLVVVTFSLPMLAIPIKSKALATLASYPPAGMILDHSVTRARGVPISADLNDALGWVRNNTAEDQPIFVTNDQTVTIDRSDVMVSFLANRPYPTRYHELHPGAATNDAVQQEIINALETQKVRNLLVSKIFSAAKPGQPLLSRLDQYRIDNFETVMERGNYLACTRRNKG